MKPDTVPSSPRLLVLHLTVFVGLLLTTTSPYAQDFTVNPAFQSRPKAMPVQSRSECTCRAKGAEFVVGTEACINNARMRCVMEQNVTSWRRMDDGCPQS